jgi:hypothetical protein
LPLPFPNWAHGVGKFCFKSHEATALLTLFCGLQESWASVANIHAFTGGVFVCEVCMIKRIPRSGFAKFFFVFLPSVFVHIYSLGEMNFSPSQVERRLGIAEPVGISTTETLPERKPATIAPESKGVCRKPHTSPSARNTNVANDSGFVEGFTWEVVMDISYIPLLILGRAVHSSQIPIIQPIAHTLGTHIQVVKSCTVCSSQ